MKFAGAYNAIQAFECITNMKPDLIVSDVMMPGVKGTELVDWLRNNTMVRHIPIVVFSGHGGGEIVDEAMRRGANGFLAKPIDSETLQAEISKYIPLWPRRLSMASAAVCDV